MRCVIALSLLLALAAGERLKASTDCETRQCLIENLAQNPARNLAFWQTSLNKPLAQRIFDAPAEVLELLRIDNRLNGYPSNVTSFRDPAALSTLQKAFAELPASVHDLIADRLAGIFLVENLGTSGYTNDVFDSEGRESAGFVVLDSSLFSRKGNEWASHRDATAFRAEAGFEIRNIIAEPKSDSPLAAVQFLLVHELGHVASIGGNQHPSWNQELWGVDLQDYPFSALSWWIDNGQYRSRFDSGFTLRKRLVFYQIPRLSGRQMPEVLRQLKRTNFVSLYAASRPEEDFAESFAVYVHSEMMDKPFVIAVLVDGQVRERLGSCFRNTCKRKYELLKSLIGS